jgi:hypothetical protein
MGGSASSVRIKNQNKMLSWPMTHLQKKFQNPNEVMCIHLCIHDRIPLMEEIMDAQTKELLSFLAENGYQNVRVLEDGTVVGTSELMFTRAVYIGLDRYGWEKRFCFQDREMATSEVAKLKTGDDEPSGYIARRGG